MGLKVDLHQVVYVLSDALDLVGVDDVAHGKRVAYMAVRCAEALGLPRNARDDLLYAGLFHDCGVSSTREHHDLAAGEARGRHREKEQQREGQGGGGAGHDRGGDGA